MQRVTGTYRARDACLQHVATAQRAALDAVVGSGTLEAEDDGCARCRATSTSQTDHEVRDGMGGAPARTALKAERGAGSAAAVSRSGAALDKNFID